MPSSNAIAPPLSIARFQLSTVNSRLFCSNPFRITYVCKNAPANPYGSHISKTKDLKSFRITYFQKSGRGRGAGPQVPGEKERVLYLINLLCPIRLASQERRVTGQGSSATDH